MDGNTKQTRAWEGVQPRSGGARIEANQNTDWTTYWGILCRTCLELTAFDTCPLSMKPGAIRCSQGHNHIYFPRDFRFFPSAVPVTDEVMQKNREAFMAINSSPSSSASSNPSIARSSEPEANSQSGIRLGLEKGKARPANLAPDPRRENAQKAAKERWANWAIRKTM